MSKNLQIRETVQASGKENVPLNTANVEEHRPEAVVVEIEGLSQQQRVSSVLQTAAFRRHLENIIRGSISSVSRNRTPVISQRPSPNREQVRPIIKYFFVTITCDQDLPFLLSIYFHSL